MRFLSFVLLVSTLAVAKPSELPRDFVCQPGLGSQACWKRCTPNMSLSSCADICKVDTALGSSACWQKCTPNMSLSSCAGICKVETPAGSAGCWQRCTPNMSLSSCADICGTK